MTDLTTKEIKGLSIRNLIGLLSGIIVIEFTVIMGYAAITNNIKNSFDKVEKVDQTQQKVLERVGILERGQDALKAEIRYLKEDNNNNNHKKSN